MEERENVVSRTIKIVIGCILAVLYLVPIIMLLSAAFKTQKNIFKDIFGFPDPIVWTNFGEAMARMDYLRALFNSVFFTAISTILIIFFASMAAWVLVRYKTKMSNFIFTLFAISMLIPFQCVMLPMMSIMGKLNMLNPVGLIFAYVGFGSALSIMLFHGFIKGIPVELEESAMLDGCSMFGVYRQIVLPLLGPIVTTVGILNIMWIWNDYLLPSLVIGSNIEWRTLPLKTFYFFGQFSSRWDYASAALILSMLPIVIFYVFAQKKIIKGVVDGAVK